MRVILNNFYQSTIDPGNVHITRSMTDPVPTCSVDIKDNNSSLQVSAMQELLVLDDKVIPNPTTNLLINPSLTSPNLVYSITGIFITVAGLNPGYLFQLSNNAVGTGYYFQNVPATVGQSYTFSLSYTINPAFVNANAFIGIVFTDAAGNTLGANQQFTTFTGPFNTLTRISISSTAPAGASYVQAQFGLTTTSSTNSGSIAFYQLQMEPTWLPTQTYPTPWCGPSQTNCVQLPQGQWIRQYRKFAGFVNHTTTGNYVGNVRTVTVDAVGYAWIASLILCNNGYTNQYDSAILTNLLNTYLPGLVNTANIVQGVQLSNVQSNWDDLRTDADNLASQSTYYWTIDYYWNAIYVPTGYITMPVSLICDNSNTPDMVTTFPAYNFSAEMDFTQPGSVILVIGSGSNVAEVIDPAQSAAYNTISGYAFKAGSTFMRKVNESSLQSVTDCTNRGMAELIQYDLPRYIYHLTTNVELVPGEAIPVTSNTDGLNATTLLIQQVSATWMGTDETLTDVWEYQADLGATNRAATNILSRIFRATNSNSSAPAISATTLAVFEKLGITDTVGQGSIISNYATTIQGDAPIAYYRLNEITGTVADDISGHAQQGTINGGVTLGTATLLTDPADSSDLAMTFNGTTGEISLPSTGTWPTGNGAWSLECWCKPTHATNANDAHLITIGNPGTNSAEAVICQTSTGGWGIKTNGGVGHDFNGNGTSTAGTIYYIAGTYDGAGHLDLYVGVSGTVTHYGPFSCGTLVLTTSVHQRIGSTNVGGGEAFLFPGVIDEPAIYNYKLSSTQVSAHYTAGT